MGKRIRSALAAAALATLASAASATVLTFDDIGSGGAVPVNYGGLDWSAGGWSYFGAVQPPYTPHSDSFRAFVNFMFPDSASAIVFGTPTTFQGAWFSGFDIEQLSFQLFLDDALVATSSTLVASSTPTFLSSGYTGLVDKVIVVSTSDNFFVMDDFTFGQSITPPGPPVPPGIPEPSTMLLMLAGFAVIGIFVGKRRR